MPKPISTHVSSMDAELEFSISPSTTGRQLFDQVAKTLGVREVWYFGLQIVDSDNRRIWLKYSRRVISQVNKYQGRGKVANGAPRRIHISFLVKFYPEDVARELIEDVTLRLFYLQVKESILDGEIYCNPEVAVLLASYAAQVRYGDYDNEKHYLDFMKTEQWLPGRVMAENRVTVPQWQAMIMEWYSEHQGMLKEDAMLEYLKIAQDLEMYGVNYYDVANKNNTPLTLGVDALGLNVYDKDNKLTPRLGFPWSEVRHLHSHRKKFLIKPMDKKAHDFVFYSPSKRMNKQILLLSAGNHQLYKRRRDGEPLEVIQMRINAKADKEAKVADRKALYLERMQRMEMEKNRVELEDKLERYQSQYHLAIQELEKSKSNLHLSHVSEDETDLAMRNTSKSELCLNTHKDFSDDSKCLRERIELMKGEIEERRKTLKLILDNERNSYRKGESVKNLLNVYSSILPSENDKNGDDNDVDKVDVGDDSDYKQIHDKIEVLSAELRQVRLKTQEMRRELLTVRKQNNKNDDILGKHDLVKYFSQNEHQIVA